MTGAERGFLLLTGHLGDPNRNVLTTAQLRNLACRVQDMSRKPEERELQEQDLISAGYDHTMAQRILELLDREDQLQWYLQRGRRAGCVPITRISEHYPVRLRTKLGLDSPGCLWAKGELALLEMPAVAVVGSRNLRPENRRFAEEVGKQAALQGYVLVSGNARGADKAAQEACLAAGGSVISVVADSLEDKPVTPNVLWLSEEDFDLSFSSQRALSRNRVIHCLGERTLVAQSDLGKGGTWDGTTKNLKNRWSPVFCFADGSAACDELTLLGAGSVTTEELLRLCVLHSDYVSFINL